MEDKKKKEEQQKDKKKWYLYIIILILLLLLLLKCCCPNNDNDTAFNVTGEDIVLNDPVINDEGQQMYEVTAPVTETINEQNQDLLLINLPNNQVYFQYDVVVNDNVIFTTDMVAPNSMVRCNLYELLDSGEYDVSLKIRTYSVETKTEKAPTEQIVHVTVNK